MHCAHRERKSLSSSTSFHKNSWIHLNFIALIKIIIAFLHLALPRRSTDSNRVSRIQAISFLFICIAKSAEKRRLSFSTFYWSAFFVGG